MRDASDTSDLSRLKPDGPRFAGYNTSERRGVDKGRRKRRKQENEEENGEEDRAWESRWDSEGPRVAWQNVESLNLEIAVGIALVITAVGISSVIKSRIKSSVVTL